MEESLLWRLIARKLSGEATAEEIEQLNEVLRKNPHAQVTFEALAAFWEHPAKEETPDNIDEIFNTHLLTAIHEENNYEEGTRILPLYKRILKNRIFKAAAIIAGIISVASVGWMSFKPTEKSLAAAAIPELPKIQTSNGTKTNTILPDGSKVWLNSGSKLIYITFNNNKREVKLEGEAYFDVIKDPKRPFIVHTNVIDIRVLGTAFNVKSYPNDKTVEAALVRGLIEVTRIDKPGQKVLLHPNEKITVLKKQNLELAGRQEKDITPTLVDSYKISGFTYARLDKSVIETSWTQNKLAFEDMQFDDLAVQLERWYDVKIHFENESLKKLLFTGSFVNETISEAMEALKLNGDFNYKISNNEIEIFTKD
jgi:ferric-dicitrate binding protein FerR (iron transport regulator)